MQYLNVHAGVRMLLSTTKAVPVLFWHDNGSQLLSTNLCPYSPLLLFSDLPGTSWRLVLGSQGGGSSWWINFPKFLSFPVNNPGGRYVIAFLKFTGKMLLYKTYMIQIQLDVCKSHASTSFTHLIILPGKFTYRARLIVLFLFLIRFQQYDSGLLAELIHMYAFTRTFLFSRRLKGSWIHFWMIIMIVGFSVRTGSPQPMKRRAWNRRTA